MYTLRSTGFHDDILDVPDWTCNTKYSLRELTSVAYIVTVPRPELANQLSEHRSKRIPSRKRLNECASRGGKPPSIAENQEAVEISNARPATNSAQDGDAEINDFSKGIPTMLLLGNGDGRYHSCVTLMRDDNHACPQSALTAYAVLSALKWGAKVNGKV
ncbi:hypothetical protein I7I51_06168 [Histoplasma capsulatum]|uniref:Uncharacterized protein n=1 Tax=Ajellomyces capsulatus TaxID=5037 RepID=A0A8A1MFP7_AJECA|nr:hypothetical protein I7I51_06168 [Histoplasma capsulatum]